jgi:hypothetical protein
MYLESGGIKKSFDTIASNVQSFISDIFLPAFYSHSKCFWKLLWATFCNVIFESMRTSTAIWM